MSGTPDPDDALSRINALREGIRIGTVRCHGIFEQRDRGDLSYEASEKALSIERALIHELAIELSAVLADLSDYLEDGGTLPDQWRDARRPSF